MSDLLELAADLPARTLEVGEVLIEQGDPPGSIYILESGACTIEQGGTAFATVDRPGAILGEMSAVLQQPATASVRAATTVRLRVAEDPTAFLVERPGAALAALRIAAARIDNLTRYLADVKRQYADLDGHLGMVDGVLNALVHHQAAPARTGSAREPDPEY